MTPPPSGYTRAFVPVLLAMPALMAFALIVWATRQGIGITPDSVRYVDAATSLLDGNGLRADGEPLTHYPPLYPLLLAIAGGFAGDVLVAARWLHALVFACTVGVVTYGAWRFSGRSLSIAVVSGLLPVAMPDGLLIHVQALSEPPFLLLALCGHLLLAHHLTCPDRRFLAAGSAAIGCALLTRYAGAALLPAPLILLACLKERPLRSRALDGALFAGLAGGPLLLWLVRNAIVSGIAANRPLAWHPFGMARVRETAGTFAAWILPAEVPFAIQVPALLAFAATIALLVLFAARRGDERLRGLVRYTILVSIFACSYIAFLVASISLMDAHTLMDARILSPIPLLLAVAIPPLLLRAAQARPEKALRHAVLLLPFALAVWNLPVTIDLGGALRANGFGYANRAWKSSEGMALLAAHPPDAPVYTNARNAAFILTGRRTMPVPAKLDTRTREPRPEFDAEMRTMRGDVQERGAILVLFDREMWRWNLPAREELAETLRPAEAERLRDALVLRAKQNTP